MFRPDWNAQSSRNGELIPIRLEWNEVIPFFLEWNGHSILAEMECSFHSKMEWSYSIQSRMEWALHSSRIGMTNSFYQDWSYYFQLQLEPSESFDKGHSC